MSAYKNEVLTDQQDGHTNSEKGNGMSSLYPTTTLSAEAFERLYLQPKPTIGGELRKVVGNPTPLALVGFCVGLTPISAQFMGWAGSGGAAAATTTDSIWFGGMLLGIAGLMEFLLGNTYTFVVFMTFSAHFLTFATSTIPWFNALAPYTTDGTVTPTPMWVSGFGFYAISMAVLSFIFLVGFIRTNLVFVIVFTVVTLGFILASISQWKFFYGDLVASEQFLVATGASFFVASCLGWYLLLAQMIAVMELPIPDLPVFDLSTVIKARPRG